MDSIITPGQELAPTMGEARHEASKTGMALIERCQ